MYKISLFASLFPLFTFSQEVISTQGESYTNSSGSIDFTIGEVVIDTESDGNSDITQGFHQTNWKFVDVNTIDQLIEIAVYPNPTNDNLKIETICFNGMIYNLSDINGRVLATGTLFNELTIIKIHDLPPSTYNLIIIDSGKPVKSFKLIKSK